MLKCDFFERASLIFELPTYIQLTKSDIEIVVTFLLIELLIKSVSPDCCS